MPDEQTDPHPRRNVFAEWMGVRLTPGEHGHVQGTLDVADEHMNPNGVVHGGAVYALADTCMGTALTLLLSEGEHCATIEIKISYYAPARPGTLACHARVMHKARRFAFLEAEVRQEQHIVARASGTFVISRPQREHPAAS